MEEQKIPEVYKGMSKVTEILLKEGIKKEKVGSTGKRNYQFRGIDDILNSLAPALVEANICLVPHYTKREVITEDGSQKILLEGYFEIISTIDNSKYTVAGFGESILSKDKSTGIAMSMFYKNLVIQVFCIPVKGIEDADTVTMQKNNSYSNTAASSKERTITTIQVNSLRRLVNRKYNDHREFLKQYNIQKTGDILAKDIYKIKEDLEKLPDITKEQNNDN